MGLSILQKIMFRTTGVSRCFLLLALGLAFVLPVNGASTVTFTMGQEGTLPHSLSYNNQTKILTIETSKLPKDATIFRADLVLKPGGRFARNITEPTNVYPVGRPDEKLKWIGPRFVSLDALTVVRESVREGKNLQLELETTLNGVERLEVSCLEGQAPQAKIPTVEGVQLLHRKGQTFVVFREPELENFPEFKTGAEVANFKEQIEKNHPGLTFRIWRAPVKITPQTIVQAKLVGECGLFTAWNNRYHQGQTSKSAPVRYRVVDNGEPLEWGTGVYAHNPAKAGQAYYAVTVAIEGEEDLDQINENNATENPIEEIVGQGEPILQWIEKPDPAKGWLARRGEIARQIYVRWEAWPHSPVPNNPIDYLVVIPLTPAPAGDVRYPQYKAFRAKEAAPVGLHLHCWGGNCNGGYGWWHNAHRGAVLIASNQIPYDWWTGHHERRGTCKTWGDGVVRPFSIDRLFGFLDWAENQWKVGPEEVRELWPKLDRKRVFTAGNSMGGSGAPMIALRHADKIAWGLGWVGVHVPELSPQFAGSYQNSYGPRHDKITLPDGKTSPWNYYSDVWWMKNHMAADTGFIIASNGKNDGAIGWKQAYLFARALQETRRPHMYNWGMNGHGTRTLIGSNFDIDVRTDQSLPAFTNCSLDDDIGDGDPKSGDPKGQYNAYLRWDTNRVVDEPKRWEMTVFLSQDAPKDRCTVDLTPRRCQKFHPKPGQKLKWSKGSLAFARPLQSGTVEVDRWGLVTLPNVIVGKAKTRIVIEEQ